MNPDEPPFAGDANREASASGKTPPASAYATEVERLNRLYSALSHVNQAIVRMPTREELFKSVCRILVEDGRFSMAWIGWYDPETRVLMPVADWGDQRNGYLRRIKIYTDDRPEGRGPTGTAFRDGDPCVSNDMLSDPALPWREEVERRGFRASAAFPIRENDSVRATLTVYADETGFFQDKEITLLSEVAVDISFALDNLAREAGRKRAEGAATLALRRLTEAQRIGQIGDWEWDMATDAITWSPQVFEIFGLDPGLGPPRNYAEASVLFDAASQALQTEKTTRAIESGEPQDYELVARRTNGGQVDVLGRAMPRKDDSGRVVGLYGTVQDITERKHSEAALEKAHRELVEASRRAGMAEIATGILHNVGNVLNSVNIASGCVAAASGNPKPPIWPKSSRSCASTRRTWASS